MEKDSVTVFFLPMNRAAKVPKGSPLLDAIRLASIPIESICGGKGLCRKCRVILAKGTCGDTFQEGAFRPGPGEWSAGYRFACQVRITDDCEFIIPVESRIDSPQILISPTIPAGAHSPAVLCFPVNVSPADTMPAPHRSIRLTGYHGARPALSEPIIEQITRTKEPHVAFLSMIHEPPEILAVRPASSGGKLYGIALDLGTTTVVGCLVDLASGEILGTGSTLNRQITYGEEVITRIGYAKSPAGRATLQQAACESIGSVVSGLVRDAAVDPSDILVMTVGANTVMNHLFSGIDPSYLELANADVPRRSILRKASGVMLPVCPDAVVYCLPNVSRFIGGDAVGDVIASGILASEEISLIIDLGTNGEIIIGNRDWLASVSCASGPALEGAGITSGMRAMKGAIDHIAINPVTSEVTYSVIGNVAPRGICGSGIIDLAAAMVTAGILDFAGKLVHDHIRVRKGTEGAEFVFVPADLSATGRDLVITQRDIDYLIDSKAALCGSISVLLKRYKIPVRGIRHVYLAGAFGAFSDISNAVAFGFIPKFPSARFHPIGNGSLSGAYGVLLSQDLRRQAERAAEMMVYIDLLVDTDFIEEYSAALYIPGAPELFPDR